MTENSEITTNEQRTNCQETTNNALPIKKKSKNKIAIIIAIVVVVLVVIAIVSNMLTGPDISTVKEGKFYGEDITVGDAFDKFFVDEEWTSFVSDDNEDIVEFNGKCTYNGESADACVQFLVDSDKGTFVVKYASINGTTFDEEELINAVMGND